MFAFFKYMIEPSNPPNSQGSTLSTPSVINIPKPSYFNEKTGELEQVNEEEDSTKQQVSPPIIIHTCPTPAQTPPASLCSTRSTLKREAVPKETNSAPTRTSRSQKPIRNSFFMPNRNYKILFNSNIADSPHKRDVHDENNENYDYYHLIEAKIKTRRKFSLDNKPSTKRSEIKPKVYITHTSHSFSCSVFVKFKI